MCRRREPAWADTIVGGASGGCVDSVRRVTEYTRHGSTVWIKRFVLAAVLAMGGYVVYENAAELGNSLSDLPPWLLPVAAIPVLVGMWVGLQVWRVLMAELGSPLSGRVSAEILFVSQLGKYVPGSVWSVLGQMELGREHQVPRRTSASVGVLVLVIGATAGVTVAVLLLPLAGSATAREYWWVLAALPLCYLVLHPPVLGRALGLASRLVHRDLAVAVPTWRSLRLALVLQCLVWVLLGLQVWILVVALGGSALDSLAPAIGGYALGYSVGMVAFGLPAGAGVREAALVVALGGVLSTADALLVALLTRLISTICDVGMAAVTIAVRRRFASGSADRSAGH